MKFCNIISADNKANVKQKEIKELVAVSFKSEVSSKLEV